MAWDGSTESVTDSVSLEPIEDFYTPNKVHCNSYRFIGNLALVEHGKQRILSHDIRLVVIVVGEPVLLVFPLHRRRPRRPPLPDGHSTQESRRHLSFELGRFHSVTREGGL